MTVIKIPVLTPIRLYNPNLSFGNNSTFQNPDNRVSTGYNWEAVNSMQYALPIPKQWADGQPGIDFLIQVESGNFYADLYDEDDAQVKSLYVQTWEVVGSDTQYRIFLDGLSGSGIADGYYTVKIFDNTDDALLFESEALFVADWFDDMIPFEFWNFENDFGITFDNGNTRYTARLMMPIRIYDPGPTFEKEVYKNDPGILTTLRVIPQREFNFDSLAIPVHVAEFFQLGFACSELYLDRIKINSEENPEAEIVNGSNMKQLTGKATFVDFNTEYMMEKVETSQVDQSIDWDVSNYVTNVITGNSIAVNDPVVSGTLFARSDSHSYSDGDVVLVKVVLTDDAGDSDLPQILFDGSALQILEWGTNWFSYRVNDDSSDVVQLQHSGSQKAVYTAVLTLYTIE